MSGGAGESEPYADSGERGWDVQPAVPGWSAGQDWYTGPIYDDTGWHIDLSDVDWAGSPRRDKGADQPAGGSATTRFERQDLESGNGAAPPGSYDRRAESPPGWTDRPSGRHARHARQDESAPAPPGSRPPGMRRRVAGSAPRTQPRRVGPPPYQPPADPDPYGPDAYAGPTAPTRARPPAEPDPYGPDAYAGPTAPTRAYPPPRAYEAPARSQPVYEEPGYAEPAYPPRGPRRPGSGPGTAEPPGPVPQDRRPGAPGGPGGPAGPGRPRGGADGGQASIVRSSGVMAAGTLGSRMTGFLRTLVQNAALGAAGIASAYNLSNTLPNVVYNLALGGILTSVIVPLIVTAARRDTDRGAAYDQRMFTLITLALLAVTLVATALATPIVHLYSGSEIKGSTQHLAIIFALFFIPQIFFYGVSSLIGAILNSRGSFAAPMWTPIVNNIVVIAVLALYIAIGGLHKTPGTITGTDVALLGFGTTLGIVVQTIALVPALRRVGFRWHPRVDFRRSEVSEIGRMGGWMFGYIAATQVAFLVTTKIAGDTATGITDYNYAWLLFQLPYAVVGISVITALLPRMSTHATERRLGLVRQDFSSGVRLAATIVVPCSLVLAVLGPRLGEVFFGHGDTHVLEARYMGVVFAVFCLGLLPYMIFQLQLRVFYSMHDSKTPALIGLVTMTVNIAANLVAYAVLPRHDLVAGLGAGFGLANVAGLLIAWRILSRRLRGLDGYHIGRSLVRMHAATLPAALLAILVGLVTGNAYLDVIIGGGLAFGLYLVFARVLRIEELSSVGRTVLSRLGR